jgi:hypothetical protein
VTRLSPTRNSGVPQGFLGAEAATEQIVAPSRIPVQIAHRDTVVAQGGKRFQRLAEDVVQRSGCLPRCGASSGSALCPRAHRPHRGPPRAARQRIKADLPVDQSATVGSAKCSAVETSYEWRHSELPRNLP